MAAHRFDEVDDGGGGKLIDEEGDEFDKGGMAAAFLALDGGVGEVFVRGVDDMISRGAMAIGLPAKDAVFHGDQGLSGMGIFIKVAIFQAQDHRFQDEDTASRREGLTAESGDKMRIHTT